MESILKGNLLSHLYLLLAIADYFTAIGQASLDFPKSDVKVRVVTVSKVGGNIEYDYSVETILG